MTPVCYEPVCEGDNAITSDDAIIPSYSARGCVIIRLIEILLEEHKRIDEMMDLLDLSVKKAKEPSGLPPGIMAKELDFCKNFINKCHEAKEEEVLVPELQKRGYPMDRGPILEMLEDHKKGRAILRRLLSSEKNAREDERQRSFSEMAAAYALFQYEHMRGEEEHILKKADIAIERPAQEALAAECLRFDEEKLGKGSHSRYLESIKEIRSGLG